MMGSDSGSYEVVSKKDFPALCARGVKPDPQDTLVVHTAAHETGSQKFYIFISETCRESAPIMDYYYQSPNPSVQFCRQRLAILITG